MDDNWSVWRGCGVKSTIFNILTRSKTLKKVQGTNKSYHKPSRAKDAQIFLWLCWVVPKKQCIRWLEQGCIKVWKFDRSLFHKSKFIIILIRYFFIDNITCRFLPYFEVVDLINSNIHKPVMSKNEQAAKKVTVWGLLQVNHFYWRKFYITVQK